ARGVLLGVVGLFDFYGARAVIGRGDDWADPVVYEWSGTPNDSTSTRTGRTDHAVYAWDGRAGYATSTRTDDTGTVTNTFTNPNFAGGVGLVTVWENLLPAPRPSRSASRYSTTDAE